MAVDGEKAMDSVLNDSVCETKRCKICGAKSTGNHYGCQSCEGCKAFFRRVCRKGMTFRCYLGENCSVTETTRDRCKSCRYQRCIKEGMMLDNLVTKPKASVSATKVAQTVADDAVRSQSSSDSGLGSEKRSSPPLSVPPEARKSPPVLELPVLKKPEKKNANSSKKENKSTEPSSGTNVAPESEVVSVENLRASVPAAPAYEPSLSRPVSPDKINRSTGKKAHRVTTFASGSDWGSADNTPQKRARVAPLVIPTGSPPVVASGRFGSFSPSNIQNFSPNYLQKMQRTTFPQDHPQSSSPEYFQNTSLTKRSVIRPTEKAPYIVPKDQPCTIRSLVDDNLYRRMSSSGGPLVDAYGNTESEALDSIRVFLESQGPARSSAESRMVASCTKPTKGFDLTFCPDPGSFLTKYWSLIRREHGSIQDTVKGVDDIVKTVYMDEIELWTTFMNTAFVTGQVPDRSQRERLASTVRTRSSEPECWTVPKMLCFGRRRCCMVQMSQYAPFTDMARYPQAAQPQTTLDNMVHLFQSNTQDEVERHTRAAYMLSGYNVMTQAQKRQRHRERGCHVWLIRHAKFIRNNDMYFLTVEQDVHYCRFWTDQLLDRDLMSYLFRVAAEINALDLSLTENYLMLALALFWPDLTDNSRPRECDFFYDYYLDILILLVGTRCVDILDRLQRVIGHFKCIQRLQLEYILTLDVSRAPFLPKDGIEYTSVKEILADADNLVCNGEWPFM